MSNTPREDRSGACHAEDSCSARAHWLVSGCWEEHSEPARHGHRRGVVDRQRRTGPGPGHRHRLRRLGRGPAAGPGRRRRPHGRDGHGLGHARHATARSSPRSPAQTTASFWLRTRTKQPLSNFLGFPIDRNIPRYTGILDAEDFAGITVYQGRGVGGGSLVNGGMAVTPKRENFGAVLPSVDADEMYATYYPRANAGLGVGSSTRPGAETRPPATSTRASAASTPSGPASRGRSCPNVYDWNYMKQEAAGTVAEVGAGRGGPLRQQPRQEVAAEDLPRPGGGHRAGSPSPRCTGSPRSGPRRPVATTSSSSRLNTGGDVVATKTVTADKVFFAAGSVGTSKLLVKLKATGALPAPERRGRPGLGRQRQRDGGRANHMWDPTGDAAVDDPDAPASTTGTPAAPSPRSRRCRPASRRTRRFYLSITKTPHRGSVHLEPGHAARST